MKVLVQWTKLDPEDWVEIDLDRAQRWRSLPKRPAPTGSEQLDNNLGYIFDLNVQGIHFGGHDHYSAELLSGGGLRVIVWNDDPDDYPPGERYAQVWDLYPLAPDPELGGQLNTRQFLTVYDEKGSNSLWHGQTTSGGPVTVLPWSDFTIPPSNMTIHGIWVADTKAHEHVQHQSRRGWRDWSDG